ncbi:hypothetical protein GCM10010300_23620 [Streptomyces olivaceoviridis]|nr:hypothetical protein GCM10010300_23620 [Streptomyces olivaceoviridis]
MRTVAAVVKRAMGRYADEHAARGRQEVGRAVGPLHYDRRVAARGETDGELPGRRVGVEVPKTAVQ